MGCKDMNDKHIRRMSFLWNAMYSGFNALQSAIILFAIARKGGLGEAGIISIGFTIATLVMIIARYGIRDFQVTDVNEEYSFSDYFYVRIITVLGSLFLTLMYVVILIIIDRYTFYKGYIVSEIVILKMVDAFEGVYVGRFQQKGRLDLGAKIATFRIVISTIVIFVCLLLNVSLQISFLVGIVIAIISDIILIRKEKRHINLAISFPKIDRINKLLTVAFPLCIGMTMYNYIGNAPKYLVDYYMSDEIQAISGYIMMPMFVIAVLNSFLMQPTVKAIGDVWNEGEFKLMKVMLIKHVRIIMVASIGVLLLGLFVGIPLLSWMYRVDLEFYNKEFILIMIGGVLYTISAYIIVILTAMRKQRWIMVGCVLTLIIYALLGGTIVSRLGLMGASILYIISNVVLLSIVVLGMVLTIRKRAQEM